MAVRESLPSSSLCFFLDLPPLSSLRFFLGLCGPLGASGYLSSYSLLAFLYSSFRRCFVSSDSKRYSSPTFTVICAGMSPGLAALILGRFSANHFMKEFKGRGGYNV